MGADACCISIAPGPPCSKCRCCHCTGLPTAWCTTDGISRIQRVCAHTSATLLRTCNCASPRAHHGSEGCRSTPFTLSVRCSSCFCNHESHVVRMRVHRSAIKLRGKAASAALLGSTKIATRIPAAP